jgi:23S rRNA (cytosine1962-C5)-methyltransferase
LRILFYSFTAMLLTLKPGKEKSLWRRHPWIFANAVAKLNGKPAPGDAVKVVSHDGKFLCWAAYSEASQIRARAWSFVEAEYVSPEWLHKRVQAAVARRTDLTAHTNAIRVVFGEADGLPGLVADRYANTLVIQFLAAGVERWKDVLTDALIAATGCTVAVERSDAAVRAREGLEERVGVLRGELDNPVQIEEYGVKYYVDVLQGHKTGFYIDQRDSRLQAAQIVARIKNADVLNCFCYTGGFTLAMLKAGASSAVSIDSSQDALAMGMRNAQINGIDPTRAQWRCENVFDSLKEMLAQERRFDVIVLDPPKFAPSAQHVDKAARAYKELNLKGLKLLKPGGHLLTYSCSGAITVDLFQKIIAGAVADARIDTQLLRRLAAGTDHPMAMAHPEGEYLKGLWLQKS